jgi:enoyl-CoA hydratase/carnithine racemase
MSEPVAQGLAAVRNRVGHLNLGDFSSAALGTVASVHPLQRHLNAWEHNPKVLAVVMRVATGEGAWLTFGSAAQAQQLALHIGAYPKPVLALLNGSVPAPALRLLRGATLRTVSERTTLRMDQSSLDSEPASDPILSRLPAALRNYLSLTGRSLRPADALYAGLADYCLPSEMIAEFDRCLDGMDWHTHPREALRTLLATLATPRMPGAELKALRLAIDEHFAFDSLRAIRHSLANESRPAYLDWADETIALLDGQCHHATAPPEPLRPARQRPSGLSDECRDAVSRR